MSTPTKKQSAVDNHVTPSKINEGWYVFYTAPRAEKIAQRELLLRGYDVFLPITKAFRVWKNRQKKIIEQVLFPSYIFVSTQETYLHKICQVPKIASFIHCGGKPSKIDSTCIEGIKKMLNLDQLISVEPNFHEGERVKIISGPLTGFEGVLLERQSKTKFGIQLDEINQTVFIDVCMSMIERELTI